jgi:hypothetical protein
MYNGERERSGNRSVDGRTARGNHIRADLRRHFVLRRDHAFLGTRRHRDGEGRDGKKSNRCDSNECASAFALFALFTLRRDRSAFALFALKRDRGFGHAADYTRFNFQRPRRNSSALTTDMAENAIAIAQNTPSGPNPSGRPST